MSSTPPITSSEPKLPPSITKAYKDAQDREKKGLSTEKVEIMQRLFTMIVDPAQNIDVDLIERDAKRNPN